MFEDNDDRHDRKEDCNCGMASRIKRDWNTDAGDECRKGGIARQECRYDPDGGEDQCAGPCKSDEDAQICSDAFATLEADPHWKEMPNEGAEARANGRIRSVARSDENGDRTFQ